MLWVGVYISVPAVTAAGGFALTATHFFDKRLKKVSKKTLAPASGPSPRLGVPSLRHSSGGIALRLASLHLHAMGSTASNGATRQSPDEHLHSAFRWGGWIKSSRGELTLDLTAVRVPLWEWACPRWRPDSRPRSLGHAPARSHKGSDSQFAARAPARLPLSS